MMIPSAFHKLGQFVVYFQHLEHTINKLLVLMAGADEENVCILINELEYSKRLKTADVLFARFVDLRSNTDPAIKDQFHELINELGKLGERRNELVHSRSTIYGLMLTVKKDCFVKTQFSALKWESVKSKKKSFSPKHLIKTSIV